MNKRRVAILSYNEKKYSETFIHHLVDRLPAEVFCLYGGELPEFYEGKSLLGSSVYHELRSAINSLAGTSRYSQLQKKVEKFFVNNQIEAVLANYSITAFPVMEICSRLNIPLITHFHGWTAYRKSLLAAYEKEYHQLFKTASKLIVVSNDMNNQLISLGAPEKKIKQVRYGYNAGVFKYAPHQNTEVAFFSSGRFCDTKNPHLTIMAFAKVLETLPHAKLRMAGGDENLLNASVSLAKALGLEDKITFCGVLPPDEIYKEMQAATAFVQHSATTIEGEKEGTPVTILEACASGLPVVATRHAGIPDVITHEESGLLFDEFDVNAQASAMIKIATDNTYALQLAENAYRKVSKNYTMEGYLKSVSDIIEESILEQ